MASGKVDFDPVHKANVVEEVAKRVEGLIVDKLQPGDTIPAERELAKLFGVSRSSIREAVRALAALGVLEPRQGSGTVVRRVPLGPVHHACPTSEGVQRTRSGELLDARLAIEPPLAGWAALHASRSDIRRLEQILSQQERRVGAEEGSPDGDLQFHYTIALAAKNDVMVKVVDVLIEVLRETQEQPSAARKELEGHRSILAALARHDALGAERAMRQHLREVGYQH